MRVIKHRKNLISGSYYLVYNGKDICAGKIVKVLFLGKIGLFRIDGESEIAINSLILNTLSGCISSENNLIVNDYRTDNDHTDIIDSDLIFKLSEKEMITHVISEII